MLLGQVLQMSQERQRLLLGAGAAAGLAAGFNAPVAGVFFALEVVLGTTFATSAVSVVLLCAVVAALIAQIGLVVDRDNHERVLGLLEREQIPKTCKVAATRQALRHYLPVPSKTEELPLPTLKQSACLPFEL